jgi:hypothetical protein
MLLQRVRARRVQRVHAGVYVDFTGPLPWKTRMWAAWLSCGPGAALTGRTAIRAYGVTGDWVAGEWADDRIQVALPHSRRTDPKTGVVVTRHVRLPSLLHPSREPPMVRLEVALLLTASAEKDVSRQAAVLLDVCRQRLTTPERILGELKSLPELRGRRVLRRIVLDAAEGVHSFLEYVYRRRVEQAHGLPRARRQVRDETESAVVYRDAEYSPYDVIVELDGLAGHADPINRWRDMTRDNAAAASGKVTLRFGYQLVSNPCLAASQVAAALRRRGWPGHPNPCTPTCPLPPVSGRGSGRSLP